MHLISDEDLDGVSMRNISKELKGLSRINDEKNVKCHC